jgi:hypothetical protein
LRVAHQEGTFVCHRCAATWLGLDPWELWTKVLILCPLGFLCSLILVCFHLRTLSVILLLLTLRGLRKALAGLKEVRRQLRGDESSADQEISRKAIRLRREKVLQGLALVGLPLVFLTEAEYRGKWILEPVKAG